VPALFTQAPFLLVLVLSVTWQLHSSPKPANKKQQPTLAIASAVSHR